jgi:hypothetical protein
VKFVPLSKLTVNRKACENLCSLSKEEDNQGDRIFFSYGCTQSKKKKGIKKRKDPLQYFSPSSNNTSTIKTTPKLQALQSDASKKGTVHKRRRCLIKDLGLSP